MRSRTGVSIIVTNSLSEDYALLWTPGIVFLVVLIIAPYTLLTSAPIRL